MAETKESIVTDEMKEQAKASARKVNEKRAQETPDANDFSKPRTKARGRDRTLSPSDVPFPEMDFGEYGPTGFGTTTKDLEITGEVDTQEFYIEEEHVSSLWFAPSGQNLPKKRLYTVKALHRDGRLVQLPSEPQIQNNAGGDPADFIGLNRYARKGIKLLVTDRETMRPLYCAAWGCFARAQHDTPFVGFCSERHARHTLPNMYRDAGTIMSGFGRDATTTSTWSI